MLLLLLLECLLRIPFVVVGDDVSIPSDELRGRRKRVL